VSEARIRIVIDRGRCIGSGQCLYAEPAVFDQDEDDGIVILLDEQPGPEFYDNVRHAARTCPGQAIQVVGDAEPGNGGGSAA
jgi:ferredoxin